MGGTGTATLNRDEQMVAPPNYSGACVVQQHLHLAPSEAVSLSAAAIQRSMSQQSQHAVSGTGMLRKRALVHSFSRLKAVGSFVS